MKITLTQSGLVSDVPCAFLNAIATNNSDDTAVIFYNSTSSDGNAASLGVPANSVANIKSLGGLVLDVGLYVDIGGCFSVEVEYEVIAASTNP